MGRIFPKKIAGKLYVSLNQRNLTNRKSRRTIKDNVETSIYKKIRRNKLNSMYINIYKTSCKKRFMCYLKKVT